MKKYLYLESSLGRLGLAERGGSICDVFFAEIPHARHGELLSTPLLEEAGRQITEYLAGRRRAFDFPMAPEGTDFERLVWKALLGIPYGETRTYRQIAEEIGRPQASRAVGRANGANPMSIVIPCHRVVGTNGRLTGYAGGLETKRRLLQLEGAPPLKKPERGRRAPV